MTYRVRISPKAKKELYGAAVWWAENRDLDQAFRWLAGIEAAIASLAEDPGRHPVADEVGNFACELRQILYGAGPRKTHRAVFEVRGDVVLVHAVRHLSQRELSPDDLES